MKNSQDVWVTDMVLPADGRETTWTDWNGTRLKCSGVIRGGTFVLAYESRQRRTGKWVILEMRDEHSVSEDGKILSVDHTEAWEGKKGKYPRPMVYDKRNGDDGAGKAESAHKPQPANKAQPPAATGQAATQAADANVFSKAQLIEDSRQLLGWLESVHPDPYLFSGGKVAFHRRFQDILQSIPPQGMAKEDYRRLLRPFVAAIKDGHTVLLRSRDEQAAGLVPLSLASVEKYVYVGGVPSDQDKPLLGAKVLSVEGVSLAEMLKRMPGLLGIENETHGLMMLNTFLGLTPLLKEVLPEWKTPSPLRFRLELADGDGA